MGTSRGIVTKGGAVLAALSLVLSPAVASSKNAKKRVAGIAQVGGIGSFTPAAADPRTAALFAHSGMGAADEFRFTPSGATGRNRAVNVVVRARSAKPALARRSSPAVAALAENTKLDPIAYNLGVGVGWKRFAVTGEVARIDTSIVPGRRDVAEFGLAYLGKRWSTRLGVSSDRSVGNDTPVDAQDSYAVDFGGSFSPAKNLELTGGLRYKIQREHLDAFADDRRDSQAVYVGTAFKF
ncbi:hypothetical protein [Sphingomonas sp. ID0503]|uniref:hypothetical protein n=1 Tax=Sphingomonas sp. ID0503 TaxID=3399691 RepID=UPI003AFB7E0F